MRAKIKYVIFALVFFGAIWSIFIEPGLLIKRKVSLNGWPLSPLKIVFFSDLHAGAPHINKAYVTDLVRRINEENADLILIGGDFVINEVVGGRPIPFDEVAAIMKELKSKHGTFAVMGNHDWWNDISAIRASLKANGIQVFENEALRIDLPQGHFYLGGVGDDYTGHADLLKTLNAIPEKDSPRLLFMHDPGAVTGNAEPVFLSLAGHMHGGQINIPLHGAIVTPGRAPREWADGLTKLSWGHLFVSKGIGTSSLPIRFNAAPEFVVIELVK